MARKIVVLENIRSAYNVGNVIRTADSLWWEVWLTGYTPSPLDNPKVKKTSLWAEENVGLRQFDYTEDVIEECKRLNISYIAAEITLTATSLADFSVDFSWDIAIIFWNEVEGVLPQTLQNVEKVVYIPMQWIKESMNIWQSTAIFMWELRNK
jgi:tRNA G18 (ribose-2'-O)-methylase SpoU